MLKLIIYNLRLAYCISILYRVRFTCPGDQTHPFLQLSVEDDGTSDVFVMFLISLYNYVRGELLKFFFRLAECRWDMEGNKDKSSTFV
jgi:hypothetical protein